MLYFRVNEKAGRSRNYRLYLRRYQAEPSGDRFQHTGTSVNLNAGWKPAPTWSL